jgi:hypothetical protein
VWRAALSSAQFFITQFWVALAWTTPFSLLQNCISDLGNTRCGLSNSEAHLYVCSPRHPSMNASFIALGLTILAGGVPTHDLRRPGVARQLARAFMVLAKTAKSRSVGVAFSPLAKRSSTASRADDRMPRSISSCGRFACAEPSLRTYEPRTIRWRLLASCS